MHYFQDDGIGCIPAGKISAPIRNLTSRPRSSEAATRGNVA